MPKADSPKAPCPECGGRKFGRGFNHKRGCSLAKPSGARPGKRTRRTARARVPKSANGMSGAFARLPVDQLIEAKRAIDETLASRRREVLRSIRDLQQLL